MTLSILKWSIASLITVISLTAGFISLRIATQYQRFLAIGDAAANGVFLGIAVFHVFPLAVTGLHSLGRVTDYSLAIGLVIASFLLLWSLDYLVYRYFHHENLLKAGLLMLTLSLHAFISGLALGIAINLTITLAIFAALIAHKGFEIFALTISLHRHLKENSLILIAILLFSLVTPTAIILGIYSDNILPAITGHYVTAGFNAFAAGTFIYISTAHGRQHHHPSGDSYVRYNHFLATLTGFALMGILAIWV